MRQVRRAVAFCISPGIIALLHPFIEPGAPGVGLKRVSRDVKTRNYEMADVEVTPTESATFLPRASVTIHSVFHLENSV